MDPRSGAFDQLRLLRKKSIEAEVPELVAARRDGDERPGWFRRSDRANGLEPAGAPAAALRRAVKPAASRGHQHDWRKIRLAASHRRDDVAGLRGRSRGVADESNRQSTRREVAEPAMILGGNLQHRQ